MLLIRLKTSVACEGKRSGDEDGTADDEEWGGEGEAAEGAGKDARKDGLIRVTGMQRTSTRMRGGDGDGFVAVMGDEVSELMATFKISESQLQEIDAEMEKLKKELAEAKTAAATAEAEVEKMKVEEKKKLEEADAKGYEAGIKRAAQEYTQTAHQMVNGALEERLPEFFELGYAAGAEAMATVLVVETDTQFRQ
ncbi:hypothetical protein RHGRI_022943 [Rhododendron griersonianum]|uniref:Uncharacterized protein n=1 Tax=Rhododendron griersonianum TaxID=479676 RepID=A0AAV6J536_9ERIC|nr:hypothetical protein RHGRI_022943 [Rhododendron griersonianum]